MNALLLNPSDPFAVSNIDPFAGKGGGQELITGPKEKIHVRFQKTGPRALTLIEGLDDDLDQKRIARAMKKAFSCSTAVKQDKNENDIIQLQGDQRQNVKDWLLAQQILTEKEAAERLVLHGY